MKIPVDTWQRQSGTEQKSVYLRRGNIHNADMHFALTYEFCCSLSFSPYTQAVCMLGTSLASAVSISSAKRYEL